MSLADIRRRLSAACAEAGRPASAVSLIAVSKTQPPDRVQAVLDAGQRRFGENRVQEALERWLPLRDIYKDIELHCIGHLQSNKAKDAVRLFDVLGAVDSEKLAGALKNEMEKQNRPLPCFLQVNTGEEAQKGGVAPKDLESLYRFCRDEGLTVAGLMCIPPLDQLPEPHFALLHKLSKELEIPGLSMGMSADFEAAIRYGATHVRVGSALFGDRDKT